MFRPLTRRQLIADGCVAALFFVVSSLVLTGWTDPLGAAGLTHSPLNPRAVTLVAVILGAFFAVALVFRRWAPGLALGLAWIGAIAQMLCGLPPLMANIAIFGILYTAAAYGSRFVFWAGLVSSLVGAGVITAYLILPTLLTGYWSITSLLTNYLTTALTFFAATALALALAWTVGALVRTGLRARATAAAQARAESEAASEAERVRIARDMHDVVAHSLAVVIAQADGARYVAAADPTAAPQALATISSTARSALADVRMLLTQLRHSEAQGPQPGIADLDELYAQVRASGVDLRIDVDPAPRGEQPAAAQLAVFRILQEALTNAMRHGAGPVEVRLAWHPDRVQLTVTNPLPVPPRASDASRGHGLIGMRERAQLVGGALEAASVGSSFVVRAALPLDGVA